MRILLIDNYDSFTYNLVHLFEKNPALEVDVFRPDSISADVADAYSKIVFSPGPGHPSEYPLMQEILKRQKNNQSILGVCLGFQAIGVFFNANLKNPDQVFHGIKTEVIIKNPNLLFDGIPSPFMAGRYHSLGFLGNDVVLPLEILATDRQGFVMAFKHISKKITGVQFHPESILSDYGEKLVNNWLDL